ncbi:ABC transporter ATP-binding protein [Streptococcus equi]|uniref:ABC transporter ATP-binding membrane protein n=6 Tax=Streptococcus equi TaxID=1336 RepID=B6YPY3_9STRE|nr:ABC transporter ATP-binding protein [Streptococcus equi]ASB96862.1 ABC transporter ATP-binding protein [Streptococcus equi subsp. equi]MBT1195735.1 ABC transporter ATP-binding protein [Streptococcus equi subsp. equi]MBT1196425.1 ABC transporter ATP-binding protein [Streptococcus equi subsp. equi]MBT1199117.1 ABC transporter ATP-binding protein [Streptococcus equi subsp. equi]MBT1200954.1 ABC transporter ATP-binding protein [Streptococcus equi subsp. equi]
MFKTTVRILNWSRKYSTRIKKGFILSFLNSVFIAMPIMLSIYVFNLVLGNYYGSTTYGNKEIAIVTTIMIGLVLGRYITAYFKSVNQDSIGYEMSADERVQIGDILKRVPLGFFQENNPGELTTAVTTDLSFFENYSMKMIDIVINGYIMALVMIISISFLSWELGVVAVSGVVLSYFCLLLLRKHSEKNSVFYLNAQSKLVESTMELIIGLPIVKAFNKGDISLKNFNAAILSSKKVNLRIEKEYTPFNCLHLFSLKLASMCIVIIAGMMAINNKIDISIMIAIFIFSFIMFSSVENINSATHVLEILDKTLDNLDKIKNADFLDDNGKDMELSSHNIVFDKVRFAYDKIPIIKDVSFEIKENTVTAIIGPSGSGKTTICNLISRFYDVSGGSIKIGNVNIKNLTLSSLLSNISTVFQKVYLFNDTIENNIKFGNPNVSKEEIINAAKKSHCHEFIMNLPNGYETIVGEGGDFLSGGEKQRISIARAMLKDAPIIILDEATSSIDPENEYLIQRAISNLSKGKTVIIIAHRIVTIEEADQIIVLKEGEIAQIGKHTELMSQDGLYRDYMRIRGKTEDWKI